MNQRASSHSKLFRLSALVLVGLSWLVTQIYSKDQSGFNPEHLTEVRTRFDVFDGEKAAGDSLRVSLSSDSDDLNWTYGAESVWKKGFFTRFVESIDVPHRGGTPHLYLHYRRGDKPTKVGIRAEVFIFGNNGQALQFACEQLFDTETGKTVAELSSVQPNAGDKATGIGTSIANISRSSFKTASSRR